MRKKLLHLITTCNVGGAEMHLFSLVKRQSKGKYDITVAFFREVREARSLVPDFRALGVRVFDLKMKNRFDFSALCRLYRFIKREKFHILHTHLFRADLFGLPIGKLAGIPVHVSTVHNTEAFFRNPLIGFFLGLSYKFARKIIAISTAVKETLIKDIGVASDKIAIIYYGLDIESNQKKPARYIRHKLGIEKQALLIGTVGRLAVQKGHRYLIEAFPAVKEEFPTTKLLIAGHDDKGLREDLEGLIARLSLEGEVFLPGYLDGTLVMDSIDVFVLPSLWEGLGLVLLEAMAAGKPIVASRVNAIPEIVIDGETGILVPPKDVKAIAKAIISMLRNPELSKEMGRKGREWLVREFSVENMVAETEKVYDELSSKS